MTTTSLSTPLGWLRIKGGDNGLEEIRFTKKPQSRGPAKNPVLEKACVELSEYMRGKRRTFKVPLNLQGTKFEKKVWRHLLTIPYGQCQSYSEVANAIGVPRGYRAVGNAVGRNPIPIVVPCHRVIRSDKSLGGFSSGIRKKIWLLKREKN